MKLTTTAPGRPALPAERGVPELPRFDALEPALREFTRISAANQARRRSSTIQKLSVVMPIFNEARTLEEILHRTLNCSVPARSGGDRGRRRFHGRVGGGAARDVAARSPDPCSFGTNGTKVRERPSELQSKP